ncbi:MAG: hypothetical protein ACMXYD_03940 [Candidatus Woesearchaeota archaeon]
MVRKELKKRRYVAAFLITGLIFLLGFFAGLVIESQRTTYLAETYNQQRVEYSSMQLQHQLIEQIAQDGDCAALRTTFEQNINNLESARVRLETFQEDATLKQEDFLVLSREYTHAQIRYYLLAQKTQELCGEEAATILYFYTETSDCPRCEDQAFVLTYLKRVLQQDLLIFSFNERLATTEPTIQLLMNRHNVTEYPTIVVNEEPLAGFVSRNELEQTLCEWYPTTNALCT